MYMTIEMLSVRMIVSVVTRYNGFSLSRWISADVTSFRSLRIIELGVMDYKGLICTYIQA